MNLFAAFKIINSSTTNPIINRLVGTNVELRVTLVFSQLPNIPINFLWREIIKNSVGFHKI